MRLTKHFLRIKNFTILFNSTLRLGNIYKLIALSAKRIVFKKKIPQIAYLSFTLKCQFKCAYCGVASYPSTQDEMGIAEWITVIDKVKRLEIPIVEFTGGEPTLREDLEQAVSYVSKNGMIPVLSTNGWELTYERLLKLKSCGLRLLCVSLNGATEKTHDAVCSMNGSFLRTIGVLGRCREIKLPCLISTILRRELIYSGELNDILIVAQRAGASGIRTISPLPVGRWQNRKDQMLSYSEKKSFRKTLSGHSLPVIGQGIDPVVCGGASGYSVFVSAYGEVQLCGYIPYSFGNIMHEDLQRIFNRMLTHEICSKSGPCKLMDNDFKSIYLYPLQFNKEIPIKLY